MKTVSVVAMIGIVLLAGCARDRLVRSPEEFDVLPLRPLEIPSDTSRLPPPGGRNLAEPDPLADGLAALGGDPRRASDARLLGAGAVLGQAARPRRGFLAGLFGGGRAGLALDPAAEAARLKAAGVPVTGK